MCINDPVKATIFGAGLGSVAGIMYGQDKAKSAFENYYIPRDDEAKMRLSLLKNVGTYATVAAVSTTYALRQRPQSNSAQ
jgi:hypothetical protein